MAAGDEGLVIECSKRRCDGKIKCTAKLRGETLHDAWIDATNAEERAAFSAAVAKDLRGVQAAEAEIEDQLLQGAGRDDAEEKERSQASRLISIATTRCELWHTPENDAHATLDVGHREHWRLRSKGFRQWLACEYFRQYKSAANGEAFQSALNTLEGMALFAQPGDHRPAYPGQPAPGGEHSVYVRLAEQGGAIYLDLCDAAWRCIVITPEGWRVADDHAIRFRRAKGMLALPEPLTGGSVQALLPFVNVSDDEWPLLLGWLLAAMRPRGPYPVLCLHGEQGSAKSTTARVLRALVDPSSAPLRVEPKEPRDLMIAATNSAVVAFDNLSRVPAWLSDALCRLSTGGGFSTRELYTDNEEVIFDAMRPVILTGIEELATRSDLLDRAVLLTLAPIPEERRRSEAEFWTAFHAAAPSILGALLTAVSDAMRRLPTVKLPRVPRMADFAVWATAGERALELDDGAFLTAYQGNRQGANELAIESSPVAGPLVALMESVGEWNGTASELLATLEAKTDDRTKRLHGWPKSPRALAGIVKRLTPNLRWVGIEVDSGRTKAGRYIALRKSGESTVTSVTTQGSSGDLRGRGDAMVTHNATRVTQSPAENGAGDADDAQSHPYSAGANGDLADPADEGMLI